MLEEGQASPLRRAAVLAPFVLFLAVYVPTAGHGFVRDDYQWVLASRVHDWRGLVGLFHLDNGFYRPLVSLTFMLNGWMFGSDPFGYGMTNIVLALLCCGSIAWLARSLGLPRGAAMLAGSLWLLNPHAIGMAVLWISGRTSLVVTLVATVCAVAWVRGHGLLAGGLLLLALLAKEEAVLLPLILLAWSYTLPRGDRPIGVRPWAWLGIAAVAEGAYFALRTSTQAMTPLTAPSYYQLTFSAPAVARNILEYADRTATFSLAVFVLALLCLGRPRPIIDEPRRRLIVSGAVWLAGAIAPMILLPIRSDLYACLPSVGVCLAVSALCARVWAQAGASRRRIALVTALTLLAALAPVYYVRTDRWVSLADLASATLSDLSRLTKQLPDESVVVIHDNRSGRASVESAFGTLLNDAFFLIANRRLQLSIEPPSNGAEPPSCAGCAALRLRLAGGHLHRE